MEELYQQYKPLLFTLAYQLTGSAADAEDAVQDVFIKVCNVEADHLEAPKAYLCKMVTNRCLDLLKSARKRRELYVGQWLPEPLPTPDGDAFEAVVRSDLLSYAMLVLLERLSPAERSVFVLREALSFDYPAIAELVGKGEAHCRKLMSRARSKMGISDEQLAGTDPVGEAWVHQFLSALGAGNVDAVLSLLAEDIVLVSDGGGKVFAATHPVTSREHVARFLFAIMRKSLTDGDAIQVELMDLNGQTGVVIRAGGTGVTVVLMHVEHGVIKNLFFMRNPDKLSRI
jgi:RNA polymerase sigma factor (sigma-70 family)